MLPHQDRSRRSQLLRANVWTGYGGLMAFLAEFNLLLRIVTRSHQEDYLGFWGWSCAVWFTALGYGIVRAGMDDGKGMPPRPVSPAEHTIAIAFLVGTVVVVWFTDNTSARLLGRGVVFLLLLLLIAADCLRRSLRR